ncbi:hypothetical protein SAMN06298216_2953 [Spirosomataceae bacterium TFI 002]|nr:hypothetical protein SAMN06298216_2953 [Spirosomataceae bacterium TFI 002]
MFLPYKIKRYSSLFLLLGVGLLYLYFKGQRPEWLNVPVFALSSSYLETRNLQMVRTNLLDELGFLSTILGVALLVFSREKNENPNEYDKIRISAFVRALLLSFSIWVLSYFLFYGYVIFLIGFTLFPIFTFAYYIMFRFSLAKE